MQSPGSQSLRDDPDCQSVWSVVSASALYAVWHGPIAEFRQWKTSGQRSLHTLPSSSDPLFENGMMVRRTLEGTPQKLRLQYLLWCSFSHTFLGTQQPHRR